MVGKTFTIQELLSHTTSILVITDPFYDPICETRPILVEPSISQILPPVTPLPNSAPCPTIAPKVIDQDDYFIVDKVVVTRGKHF